MASANDKETNTNLFKEQIEPGDTVVCKNEVASAGIYENKSYRLQSIYAQRFDAETQKIVKMPLQSLDEPVPVGYVRYITLYSPVYHDDTNGVVVTPEEVGLTSVRTEIIDAAWLAVPGFFWVAVALSFVNYYDAKTGGASFLDALLGR